MGLKEAMTTKGVSIEGLASKTGMQGAQIAGYRSGGRALGWDSAIAIAKALDFEITPRELMFGNQSRALGKARDRGDVRGVLKTVKKMVSTVEKAGHDDPELEAEMDALTDWAVKFAESHGGPFSEDDYVSFDGRDRMGRRVESLDPDDEDEEDDTDDPYGYTLEGRDSRGIRRS